MLSSFEKGMRAINVPLRSHAVAAIGVASPPHGLGVRRGGGDTDGRNWEGGGSPGDDAVGPIALTGVGSPEALHSTALHGNTDAPCVCEGGGGIEHVCMPVIEYTWARRG